MKIIYAKFTSKCAETGRTIKKGEQIAYDYSSKKAYCTGSSKFKEAMQGRAQEQERNDDAGYVSAQEDAYFDNFSRNL